MDWIVMTFVEDINGSQRQPSLWDKMLAIHVSANL